MKKYWMKRKQIYSDFASLQYNSSKRLKYQRLGTNLVILDSNMSVDVQSMLWNKDSVKDGLIIA